MQSILRTLLIVENESRKLLYGHSIVWVLSELDYRINQWKKFTSGNISAYFKDIEDDSLLYTAIDKGVFDLSPEIALQISFDFPESEEFFLEKSYDEDSFNPLIGLCGIM